MGGMTLMALADARPDLFGSRIRAAALVSSSAGQITQGAFGLPRRFDPAAALLAPRAVNLVGTRVERRAARARERAAARLVAAQLQRSGLRRVGVGEEGGPAGGGLFLSDLAVVAGPADGGGFLGVRGGRPPRAV